MYKHLFHFLAATTLLFNSCSFAQSNKNDLSVTDFAQKLKELPEAPVLDVRTPEEFSKGHLQNAINIDWNGSNFQNQVTKLDKSKPIFVYCLSGGRSSSAANEMRSLGFKEVFEMNGGIMKWRAANLPEAGSKISENNGMTKKQYDELTISGKIVLIDFYADWCAPCKKMKPYLDEISKNMSDKVMVIRINADNNQQLCKELKVDALPVLKIYKNKVLTWSNTGFVSKEEVLKQLNSN